MENWYKKAVMFGHKFQDGGRNEYISIEWPEGDYSTLKCVKSGNYNRWKLLRAWKQNKVYKSEEEEKAGDLEKVSYEIDIPVEDLEPIDVVRFITPNYETRFTVRSGSKILFYGEERRVVYIDQTHFYLVGKYWDAYHICQFAEICERNNITVEPV